MVTAWRWLVGSPPRGAALCCVLLFAFKVTPLYVVSWPAVALNVLALLVARLRARLVATAAAGPLSNLAVLAASVWTLSRALGAPDATCRPVPALAFAVVNGMIFIENAVPLPAKREPREERMPSSDGWNVLAAPFRDPGWLLDVVNAYVGWKVRGLMSLGRYPEAIDVLAENLEHDPESPFVRVAYAEMMVARGSLCAAVDELRSMLDEGTPELYVAPYLAWAYAMQDPPARIEEADRLSALVLDRHPTRPLAYLTRGAVLLARGCLEEAEELLTFAFEIEPTISRAVTACLLTTLHARKGSRAQARAWLEKARRWNPRCYLLPRAEAAVETEGAAPRGECLLET